MHSVSAPEGFEGSVYFCDGSRSWKVAIRRIGETWWKNIYMFGHAHVARPEVLERARAALQRHVELGSAYATEKPSIAAEVSR